MPVSWQSRVQGADRSQVESYYHNNRQRLNDFTGFIDDTNFYKRGTISKIRNDGRNVSHVNDLKAYIAASAPVHCIDGWSYLGRSLTAMSQGDTETARHLAYYAELRGAISLLASNGIGIFNNKHGVVHQNGMSYLFTVPFRHGTKGAQGTHEATWTLLDEWSQLPNSSNLLADLISYLQIPFETWLVSAGVQTQTLPVTQYWLKSWGFDIQTFRSDRDVRNEVSYRPSLFRKQSNISLPTLVIFLAEFWKLFEPGQQNRFELIDKYLVRCGVENAMRGLGIINQRPIPAAKVKNMLNNLNLSPPVVDRLYMFFRRNIDQNDPFIIVKANSNNSIENPQNQFEIISRAVLMLRLATGSMSDIFKQCNINFNHTKTWWSNFGNRRALWSTQPANGPTDTWVDLEPCIDNLETLINDNHINDLSQRQFFSWLGQANPPLLHLDLFSCEAIGLWGLS